MTIVWMIFYLFHSCPPLGTHDGPTGLAIAGMICFVMDIMRSL